jgi:ribosomal protein L30/L7E
MSTFTVTQHRSRNGCNKAQLATLRSLGLRRIGHTVGMLHAVRHLISVSQDES